MVIERFIEARFPLAEIDTELQEDFPRKSHAVRSHMIIKIPNAYRFVLTIICLHRLRGGRGTIQVTKEFWLQARGSDLFSYAG